MHACSEARWQVTIVVKKIVEEDLPLLGAGRAWPPPPSSESASAALVALLKEPESEPEPRKMLLTTHADPYDSPGPALIKANKRSQELYWLRS